MFRPARPVSQPAPSSPWPKQKSKKRKQEAGPLGRMTSTTWILAGVGLAGALAVIGGILALFVIYRSNGGRGGENRNDPGGGLVTVDAAEGKSAATPPIAPPEPDPAGRYEPFRPEMSAQEGKALWSVPVDAPPAAREAVAADLDVPIPPYGVGRIVKSPLFASLNGPYALVTTTPRPDAPKPSHAPPGGKKLGKIKPGPSVPPGRKPPGGKGTPKIPPAEKPPKGLPAGVKFTPPPEPNAPPPPSAVIDLRNGKSLGEFSGQVWGIRLSPDGQYLITPDSDRLRNKTASEGFLYVWKRNADGPADKPAATLKMPGHVRWMDFIGPDRLAMLTLETDPPGGVLHVFDVVKAEVVRKFSITKTALGAPEDPRNPQGRPMTKFTYSPASVHAALSPTGRYLALAGIKGIVIVSLADGKEIGLLTIPTGVKPHLFHKALCFSADGSLLYWAGAYLPGDLAGRGTWTFAIKTWDFATGRLVQSAPLAQQPFALHDFDGAILPGPEPMTVIHRRETFDGQMAYEVTGRRSAKVSMILESQAGATLQIIAGSVVGWAGPDRLLVVSQSADRTVSLKSQPFDRRAFQSKAGPKLAVTAPRPAVLKADRSAIKHGKPEPPAKWSPPPPRDNSPLPAAETVRLTRLPVAAGSAQTIVLEYVYQKTPRSRHELHWRRLDRKTAEPVGDPILLWPWIDRPDEHHLDPTALSRSAGMYLFDRKHPRRRKIARRDPAMRLPHVALTADDSTLAACDPFSPARVDVWTADGKRVGGLEPYGASVPIDWLGWSAGGKLLTAGAGKLTAWDPTTGKASYEVEGDYTGPVAAGPAGKWVALAHGSTVDLIDADSGRCLGRCVPAQARGAIQELAVAPDGKAVAAVRLAKEYRVKDASGADVPGPRYLVDLWDLKTGKSIAVGFGTGQLELIHWTTPRHLLAVSGKREPGQTRVELIDRAAGALVCTYRFYGIASPGQPGNGEPRLAGTPDGRLWLNVPAGKPLPGQLQARQWRTAAAPNPTSAQEQFFLAADARYLDLGEIAVRVEVSLSDKARSGRIAKDAARRLQRLGFSIGPKGWVLRLSHQVMDSQTRLSGGSGPEGIPIPKVRFRWQLLDEAGNEVWSRSGEGVFAQQSSKYFTKSKRGFGEGHGPGWGHADYYDFQGQDTWSAIANEILDYAPNTTLPMTQPAGKVLKAGGRYAMMPVALDFTFPPEQ
jgi:hypothetical protein